MRIIQAFELPVVLSDIAKRGARPISVYLETFKTLCQRDRVTRQPHQYGATIRKLSKISAFLNFDYTSSVNRQREREGVPPPPFAAQPNWFIHSEICRAVVEHDSKLYVQLKVERGIWRKYYTADDAEVRESELVNLLPKVYKPQNQGTQKAILTIVPAVDSILAFVCDGETYCIGQQYDLERLGETVAVQIAMQT